MGYRFRISVSMHWSGGLQSGGQHSRATYFGSRRPLTGRGAYSLGASILGLLISDLGIHSLVLGPTVGGPTIWGATISGYRFRISASTHWSGGRYYGGRQSRATDFGSRRPLTGLGASSLGAYSLGLPISDFGVNALVWGPTIWGPTFSGY